MKQILPLPNSQLQETLYELIKNPSITVRQMMAETGMLNVKARISNLRLIYNLPIETEMIKVKNKYGRTSRFGQWSIPKESKESSIEAYLKLVKDEQ